MVTGPVTPSPGDPGPRRRLTSRRVFLAAMGALAAVGAAPFLRSERGRRLARSHVPGRNDPSTPDAAVTRTVAHVVGALHGKVLDAQDLEELTERIAFAQQEDDGWRTDFASLAGYMDRLARDSGASSFAVADPEQQERVVEHVMARPAAGTRSDWLALLSADERVRRRARSDSIPFLARLYRFSGVPWRARGYTHWIGVPGDPLDYTRPGPERSC